MVQRTTFAYAAPHWCWYSRGGAWGAQTAAPRGSRGPSPEYDGIEARRRCERAGGAAEGRFLEVPPGALCVDGHICNRSVCWPSPRSPRQVALGPREGKRYPCRRSHCCPAARWRMQRFGRRRFKRGSAPTRRGPSRARRPRPRQRTAANRHKDAIRSQSARPARPGMAAAG